MEIGVVKQVFSNFNHALFGMDSTSSGVSTATLIARANLPTQSLRRGWNGASHMLTSFLSKDENLQPPAIG